MSHFKKQRIMERKSDEKKSMEVAAIEFELKQLDQEDSEFFYLEGFAATYGNVDHNDDIIMPGAFTESLETRTPVMLWQHNQSEPIGVISDIKDTDAGLFITAKLPKADSMVSGRVIPQIKCGTVRKMSIGWITEKATYNTNGIRLIEKGELLEVSVVTVPMNDQAAITGFKNRDDKKIEVKDLSFLDELEELTPKNLERVLCESKYFSNNAAKKLVSVLARASREPEQDLLDDEHEVLAELKKAHETYDNALIAAELAEIKAKLS